MVGNANDFSYGFFYTFLRYVATCRLKWNVWKINVFDRFRDVKWEQFYRQKFSREELRR